MQVVRRIALTPGEPAGIGPDLCVRIAQRASGAQLVAVADPQLLAERAARLGLALRLRPYDPEAPSRPHEPGTLVVAPVALAAPVTCGVPDAANAEYVLQTLRAAVDGCLQGAFSAMVTGPVHKGVINEAGRAFTGHTEFLAEATGTPDVVMMLASPGLRVALVTTHLPLREVCRAVTAPRLGAAIRVLHEALRTWWGIAEPRLLICGLNPHAGEGGHLGREEIEVITPVLQALRAEGMRLEGPMPADTVFVPKCLREADAVLAMYHDQGLPVVKHAGFGAAVNITLGLPFVRTSVDHGTALDLAGTGEADCGSLEAALRTAQEMIGRRR